MYTLIWLSKKLLLVKWRGDALTDETRAFINELYNFLNEKDSPFYIISDLRHGQIKDHRTFSRIRFLMGHDNWAGSTGFYTNPISDMYDATFEVLKPPQNTRDYVFKTPEQAIGFLEFIEPGVTANVHWSTVFSD